MSKFSAGSGMFYPDFSETEKVTVVRADEDRYRSRMKRLKNRSDQGVATVLRVVENFLTPYLLATGRSKHCFDS